MTTQEVKTIIGPPHTVRVSGNIVRYVWVEVSMLDFSSKSLSIDFQDDKAVSVPPLPDEFR